MNYQAFIDTYKEDLTIGDLETDCCNQPSLYAQYHSIWSDALHDLQEAIEQVKTCRSLIIKDMTENPKKYTSSAKPTTQLIEATYRADREYITNKQKEIDMQLICNKLEGIVIALRQRKYMLELEVSAERNNHDVNIRQPQKRS